MNPDAYLVLMFIALVVGFLGGILWTSLMYQNIARRALRGKP